MKWYRLVIAIKAKESQGVGGRWPRRHGPRNDVYILFFMFHADDQLHGVRDTNYVR